MYWCIIPLLHIRRQIQPAGIQNKVKEYLYMEEGYKRRFGDRRDARWVRETPALQVIMGHLFPNRCDCECYLKDELDITDLMPFLEKKNQAHPDYKTTLFQALIFMIVKMFHERPKMNYFVQGRRMYERFDISASFIARRRFTDHSEEALMFFVPKAEDTLDTLSYKISGEIHEMRKSETATGGIDMWLERFAKIPRILLMLVMKIIKWLDFWGLVPKAFTDGDTNYSSVLLSNLGSVGCPSVYHHLNNYGTNSVMVTVGVIHQEERMMPDGTKQMRTLVDLGVTVDERIADGFYFARSLKLLKHICANPEILDQTIFTPSGFDYK